MGNILSFVLEQPEKYKRNLFLETEIISLSSMVYKGENMLVIESKAQAECRVLLNRADLIKLQYLEWSIAETVARKSTLIRSVALSQFQIIGDYIDREFTNVKSSPKNKDEMIIFIKNFRDDSVISNMPKNDVNFISQLKMFASYQLAEQWAQRWNGEMSPELFTESEMRLISPPRYSSMSPMHDEDNEARAADEDRGIKELLTPATWAPTKSMPVSSRLPTTNTLPDYDSDNFAQDPYGLVKAYGNIEPSPTSPPAVDENDGPTSFNHSPSIELPKSIERRRATINPHNTDQQCFKWAILARHVTEQPVYRVGKNYSEHENKYNFEGISYPTPMTDIKIFEKNNRGVSVNVYGLNLKIKNQKFPKYEVFPLRVVDDEKPKHFDMLFISNASGVDEKKGVNTTIVQKHQAMSYGFIVKASDDVPLELLTEHGITTDPVIYRGSEDRPDVATHFVEAIVEISRKIETLLKTNTPIIMSDEQEKTHQECTSCNLCLCYIVGVDKVRDHDHLSGKFRQTLCAKCNLALQQPKFVPVFFHNLSNYDSHYIISQLGFDTNSITVIPNSEEKYISFSKYISSNFTVRFIDTFRFMATSLEKLATNMITPLFENFRETAKHFVMEKLPLVTRKGVYPYEYTDSWSKLDEVSLPGKEEFYSTLTESGVWTQFECKTLGEYSDLYLKIDVLLLADVFENFRDLCMNTYNLDAAHYYTAPGLSFDAYLKYTKKKLELLTDYDMLLMFEKGIRGGLVQASMRHAKANNHKTPDYDSNNNLYGWAMSEYMPYGDFKWVKPELEGLNVLTPTSNMGRVYEVDVSYPQQLHDRHNDLPFLPQNSVPRGTKVRKLMATFENKKNYIVHYQSLQQAIANGLIVEKVHRVLEFSQSPWLAQYINLNTEMRQKAKNDFEKGFFKLMNNAVFGKTMESVRKRIKMELVSSEQRLQKLINKTTFKHATNYSENLNAVTLENKIIKFDKPIYIGFAVLDISKTLMYDYHYNVMQKHYGDNIKLMYTDTDSLIYYILTRDLYSDLIENPILLDRLDTSDLPPIHPCYTTDRKKVPGFFSDEIKGHTMMEFCALRAKSYAYNVYAGEEDERKDKDDRVGRVNIKAKGIRGHVVKNHMTLADHVKCLFGDKSFDKYTKNVSIRSFKHQIKTIRTNKLTYNNYDDKRVVLDDKIHTLAHGHYSLEDDNEDDWPELDEEGQDWNEEDKGLMRHLLRDCMSK
ncbi:hypothetical protein QTP88_015289 [Uroleucon formosanum]